jgi:RNA polymerase sigma-70 factor (ECF subfamily)
MDNQDNAEIGPDLKNLTPEAWHAMYDEHAESVWRLVGRLTGSSSADTADVVQETFLEAARSAGQFDAARGSQRAWLCGIARRQVALHFRRRQRQSRLLTGDGRPAMHREHLVAWLEGQKNAPPDYLSHAETVEAVRVALAELTEPHAAVLIARYFDGLTVDQIARDEGCGATAVRSRLARARKAFRRAIVALSPSVVDADAGDFFNE